MFQLKLETSISACRWPRLIFSVFQTLFRPHELSDLSAQTALPRSRHGRWRGRRGRGRCPHVARWFFSHFGAGERVGSKSRSSVLAQVVGSICTGHVCESLAPHCRALRPRPEPGHRTRGASALEGPGSGWGVSSARAQRAGVLCGCVIPACLAVIASFRVSPVLAVLLGKSIELSFIH